MTYESMTSLLRACPPCDFPPNLVEDVLALADDELVIGHRHSEWLGLSPFLEEDLTMASVAQDEIGHARALYRLPWPDWEDRDEEIVRRDPEDWRSCTFVERRSQSWEFALVRHALYDIAEPLRWKHLLQTHGTQLCTLSSLVPNVLAEESFHLRHATELTIRLATSGEAANAKLQAALNALWDDAVQLTTGTNDDHEVTIGFIGGVTILATKANLTVPTLNANNTVRAADRRQRHGDFADIGESMLAVFRFDPEASW